MYVDCLVSTKEKVVILISVTPSQGHQSSNHEVLRAHVFPFPFMEHSEAPGGIVVGSLASSERAGELLCRQGELESFLQVCYSLPIGLASWGGDIQPSCWRAVRGGGEGVAQSRIN